MFEKTADKLTRGLCGRGVIAESEAALYRYGFDMALTMLLNIISTAAVGLIFGMVFESIAFLVCYIPLRSYAGGYHSETPLRCYFLSLAMIAAVLSALKLLPFGAAGYAVIMAAGAALCALLYPVEDHNKPLDEAEVRVYRRRALTILAAEVCIWAVTGLLLRFKCGLIPMSVFTEGLMLASGRIKNARLKK